MHDRVEAFQVRGLHIAQVLADLGKAPRRGAEHAILEQARVEAHHLVAGGKQHRNCDAADVACVTR